ncbi:hypothetical protein PIB30_020678 [Stylosanthes scabra]|uniref:Uncharacterized protein n=1 Tax=Stylosanthes scabra TaxID=79078 RepID=A0ABU6W6W7_9FABA|nr:hypothetical protein [Stylosanthes scabra]
MYNRRNKLELSLTLNMNKLQVRTDDVLQLVLFNELKKPCRTSQFDRKIGPLVDSTWSKDRTYMQTGVYWIRLSDFSKNSENPSNLTLTASTSKSPYSLFTLTPLHLHNIAVPSCRRVRPAAVASSFRALPAAGSSEPVASGRLRRVLLAVVLSTAINFKD